MSKDEQLTQPDGPLSDREAKRLLNAEVEKDWVAFPDLPGEHLSWRKAGWGDWELVTESNGVVSVRREYKPLFTPRFHIYTSQGRTYAWWGLGKRKWKVERVADLVDLTKNAPVLRSTGVHHGGKAGTGIALVGQPEIRFPVRGAKSHALMSAVDSSGNNLIAFRAVRSKQSTRVEYQAAEAVVAPIGLQFQIFQLLVAVSASLLFQFSSSMVVADEIVAQRHRTGSLSFERLARKCRSVPPSRQRGGTHSQTPTLVG